MQREITLKLTVDMDDDIPTEDVVDVISEEITERYGDMEIGHFETIPFISHKPECRSMADHVLMFEHGKNPYWC